jgi:hypothetical protein
VLSSKQKFRIRIRPEVSFEFGPGFESVSKSGFESGLESPIRIRIRIRIRNTDCIFKIFFCLARVGSGMKRIHNPFFKLSYMLQVFSLTRVVMNVSQLAGPWVGGMLYELDGFYLPFLVMGIIQVRNIVNFYVSGTTKFVGGVSCRLII